jgi:uncharacterized damage-inducible protein DinB
MSDGLVELFRHKTWATLLLIEVWQALHEEMLDATTPGTYGTIRDTLRHMVGSDESYLATVTGELPDRPLPGEWVSLTALAELTRRLRRSTMPSAIVATSSRCSVRTGSSSRAWTPAKISMCGITALPQE